MTSTLSTRLPSSLSFPNLHTLSLNKTRISDIDTFLCTIKTQCQQLTYLSLHGNQGCPNELVEKDEEDYQRHRYYVIDKSSNLKFLDSRIITAKVRLHFDAFLAAKFRKNLCLGPMLRDIGPTLWTPSWQITLPFL